MQRPTHTSLTVCLDIKNPNSYLAWAPTCELSEKLGIQVNWQPFVGPMRKALPAPTESDDRGTRHRHTRAEYQRQDLLRYAASAGVELRVLDRVIDSSLAAIGILWSSEQAPGIVVNYIDQAFQACWRHERDISDVSVIRSLLGKQVRKRLDLKTTAFQQAHRI